MPRAFPSFHDSRNKDGYTLDNRGDSVVFSRSKGNSGKKYGHKEGSYLRPLTNQQAGGTFDKLPLHHSHSSEDIGRRKTWWNLKKKQRNRGERARLHSTRVGEKLTILLSAPQFILPAREKRGEPYSTAHASSFLIGWEVESSFPLTPTVSTALCVGSGHVRRSCERSLWGEEQSFEAGDVMSNEWGIFEDLKKTNINECRESIHLRCRSC